MIILYQVAIFAIIILSSFAGFKGLFISVCLIVGFSLSNIFTAKLLVIQFTTIVVSTVIGVIIATIKLILNMPRIINDKFNSIKEYFQVYRIIENKYLSQYLLRCGCSKRVTSSLSRTPGGLKIFQWQAYVKVMSLSLFFVN